MKNNERVYKITAATETANRTMSALIPLTIASQLIFGAKNVAARKVFAWINLILGVTCLGYASGAAAAVLKLRKEK